jgi:hypothetical protein
MAKAQSTEQKTDVDAPNPVASTGFKFKVKKHVTLPLLKQEDGKPIYIKTTGAIFQAKELEGQRARKNAEGQVQQPPHLMHVTNLETGEEMQIIANEVLKSTLEDAYPNESYVGKSFAVERKPIQKGKKYATFTVTEIEVA